MENKELINGTMEFLNSAVKFLQSVKVEEKNFAGLSEEKLKEILEKQKHTGDMIEKAKKDLEDFQKKSNF